MRIILSSSVVYVTTTFSNATLMPMQSHCEQTNDRLSHSSTTITTIRKDMPCLHPVRLGTALAVQFIAFVTTNAAELSMNYHVPRHLDAPLAVTRGSAHGPFPRRRLHSAGIRKGLRQISTNAHHPPARSSAGCFLCAHLSIRFDAICLARRGNEQSWGFEIALLREPHTFALDRHSSNGMKRININMCALTNETKLFLVYQLQE